MYLVNLLFILMVEKVYTYKEYANNSITNVTKINSSHYYVINNNIISRDDNKSMLYCIDFTCMPRYYDISTFDYINECNRKILKKYSLIVIHDLNKGTKERTSVIIITSTCTVGVFLFSVVMLLVYWKYMCRRKKVTENHVLTYDSTPQYETITHQIRKENLKDDVSMYMSSLVHYAELNLQEQTNTVIGNIREDSPYYSEVIVKRVS
ncbi:uncharacterized protein LOC116412818 [Galleria mellonella]|uniref:Uncharacterized protein LOC116412818 n=1 Tax=Galleria mellonella TaxID=7137 RepID=A0ABM3MCC0_GALME|nr:uncharacterized protein LOC116412818 [Galleria mellonella]